MPILSLRVFTFDWLKIALGVGAISGLVALVCLGCVVWANGNSRNLALAGGALGRYGGINEDFVLIDGRREGKAESV
jgi:hypothetical protein